MATIDKRSKKSWRARVTVQGFEDKTRSFDTRAEAVEWANRVEAQLLAGVDAVPDLAAEMTLEEALDKYEKEETRQEERSCARVAAHPCMEEAPRCQAQTLTPDPTAFS